MKRKFDFMTILGLLIALGLMFFGMTTGKNPETGKLFFEITQFERFIDPTSVAITFGGTFAVLVMMFPLSQLGKIPKHMKILVLPRTYEPSKYIETLVECAKKARMNGLLALEEDVTQMTDSFLKNSLQMVVDSVDPEKVRVQMDSWLDSIDERHVQERSFYDKGAALGPAFGMLGTLIGLVNMLQQMNDIEALGPNMAVSLITTFYGSLLANVIFMPISNKLRVRHDEEYLCMRLICEGVQAIQAGENPKLIEDRLLHLLPEYKQKKLAGKSGADEGGEDGGRGGKGGKGDKEKKSKKEKKK